jgi:hypothetical protein
MTIRTINNHPDITFTANTVLFATKHVIDALARTALEDTIEANLDMYVDADISDGEATRESIQKDLNERMRAATLTFLEDALTDYKRCMLAAVSKAVFEIKVRGLDYSSDGRITDIKLDFSYTPA